MSDERVSIVIPAYNAGRWVARAIESALAQDWPDVEIIVVNDGSTDNTEEVCLAYGDRIRYFRQENRGVSAARNRGIEASTGSLIGFLDADDELMPHMVSTLARALRRWPDAAAASGAFIHRTSAGTKRVPPMGVVLGGARTEGLVDDFFSAYARWAIVWTGAVLVRREVLRQLGGFRTDLWMGEDQEMWSRIAGQYPWVFVDREIAVYNNLPHSSITMDSKAWIRSNFLSCLYLEEEMKEKIRPALFSSYRRFRRDRAVSYCRGLIVHGEVRRAREALGRVWPVPVNLSYFSMMLVSQLSPRVVVRLVGVARRLRASARGFCARFGRRR
jgi:glycosyltransferase involved in cell wall biosynthesis